MSRFSDQISSTGVWQHLADLKERLASVEVPEDRRDLLERSTLVVNFYEDRLKRSVPEFLAQASIAEAASHLATMNAELTQFQADAAPGHIDNVSSYADNLVRLAIVLPFADLDGELASATETLRTFQTIADQENERLRQRVAELEQLRSDLEARYHATLAETQTKLLQVDQRAAEQGDTSQQRLNELVGTIESQKARLDAVITDYQGQFSVAQDKRTAEFTAQRDATMMLFNGIKADFEAEHKELIDKEESAAKEVLADLEQLKAQAAKVNEAIGVIGLAEGYGQEAKQQREEADKMRKLAIAAIVATIGAAVYAFASSTHNSHFSAGEFGAKIIVSGLLASLSGYLISQSALHRTRERVARRTSLELATIDPYLALMPENSQIELKTKLADGWFGHSADGADAPSNPDMIQLPTQTVLKRIFKSLES